MEIIKEKFSLLMNVILKIVLTIIIVSSIGGFFASFLGFNFGTLIVTLIEALAIYIGYKLIVSKLKDKDKVIYLIIIAAILRVLWILNADTVPVSDFKTMFNSGAALLNGDTSIFKGLGYIGRYPHLVVTTLYMALVENIFQGNSLIAMKVINLILGLVVVYLIYGVAKEVFEDEKKSQIALLLAVVFPPLVTYTPVFCSENIAMPFYLLSIYFFIKALKKGKNINFVLSGVFLSFGNLFRMVGIIIIAAYMVYLILYYKENILNKFKAIILFLTPYVLILICASSIIEAAGITETPLWKGSEPKITSSLKGVNVNALGRWNEEDAEFIDKYLEDYDTLEEKCKEVIIDRLTNTSPISLGGFIIAKIATQWNMGDFAGSYWSQLDLKDEDIIFKVYPIGSTIFQLIYVVVLFMIFIGLFDKKNRKNDIINLFYLIFCAFGGAYLLLENQSRYAYIVSFAFVILFISGIDKCKVLKNKYRKKKA